MSPNEGLSNKKRGVKVEKVAFFCFYFICPLHQMSPDFTSSPYYLTATTNRFVLSHLISCYPWGGQTHNTRKENKIQIKNKFHSNYKRLHKKFAPLGCIGRRRMSSISSPLASEGESASHLPCEFGSETSYSPSLGHLRQPDGWYDFCSSTFL